MEPGALKIIIKRHLLVDRTDIQVDRKFRKHEQ